MVPIAALWFFLAEVSCQIITASTNDIVGGRIGKTWGSGGKSKHGADSKQSFFKDVHGDTPKIYKSIKGLCSQIHVNDREIYHGTSNIVGIIAESHHRHVGNDFQ